MGSAVCPNYMDGTASWCLHLPIPAAGFTVIGIPAAIDSDFHFPAAQAALVAV